MSPNLRCPRCGRGRAPGKTGGKADRLLSQERAVTASATAREIATSLPGGFSTSRRPPDETRHPVRRWFCRDLVDRSRRRRSRRARMLRIVTASARRACASDRRPPLRPGFPSRSSSRRPFLQLPMDPPIGLHGAVGRDADRRPGVEPFRPDRGSLADRLPRLGPLRQRASDQR